MLLGRYLNQTEQLEDALAAIQEVKTRLDQIGCQNPVLCDEPRLFETMIYSRLSQQRRAVEIAERLRDWRDYDTSVAEFKEVYAAHLEDTWTRLLSEVWQYPNLVE